MPNLKHFQYLLALHQHQNFHRAAAACFVSQSTLSSAIIKLEEQLCCQLIERDNKSFIFTALGEEVVEKAKTLLVQTTELVDFCQANGRFDAGKIRLGCIPTIAPFLLGDFIRETSVLFPDIELFIREDTTENLLVLLDSGELDLLILALPVEGNKFQCKVAGNDPFYVLAPKPLLTLLEQRGQYQNLPDHSIFLLTQEHCLTSHTISACDLAEPEKIHSFHASSISTLLQMAEHHQGMTFLPKIAVDKGIAKDSSLALQPVANGPFREIGLMWRPTSLRKRIYLSLTEIVSNLLKKTN